MAGGTATAATEPRYLLVAEVARLTGWSAQKVRTKCRAGTIPTIRVRGEFRIEAAQLAAMQQVGLLPHPTSDERWPA